jgi:hypothetical protein
MPQSAHSCQSACYSYTCPYPWSQFCSCCCQVERRPWEINDVAVEEAQEAPDVVIGMFLVNDTSVVVLFDS